MAHKSYSLHVYVCVLLQAITALQQNANGHKYSMKFTQYAQSSKCHSNKDSSVSYASASFAIE